MAGEIDVFRNEPVHSMVRFGFDLTSGTGAIGDKILTGAFASPAQLNKVLWAFSYGLADSNAIKAGFGKNTAPRREHTVLDRAGIVPLGGQMDIEAISFEPQILYTPSTLTSVDTRVDDNVGDQNMVADWIGSDTSGNQLRTYLINYLNRNVIPFWSYGEGSARNYLGGMSQMPPHGYLDGNQANGAFIGGPFQLKPVVPWRNVGDGREFRVGFEITGDQKNAQWVASATPPATGPGRAQTKTMEAIGMINTGAAAPAAGAVFCVLDVKVTLYGFRKEVTITG